MLDKPLVVTTQSAITDMSFDSGERDENLLVLYDDPYIDPIDNQIPILVE
jgi:hypothetical protein